MYKEVPKRSLAMSHCDLSLEINNMPHSLGFRHRNLNGLNLNSLKRYHIIWPGAGLDGLDMSAGGLVKAEAPTLVHGRRR